MHVLFAEFTAREGDEELVRRLIVDYAEVVRSEPGNVLFEVFEKAGRLGDFFVFEKYADDRAFGAHLGSKEGERFNAALGPHIKGGASRLTTLDTVGD